MSRIRICITILIVLMSVSLLNGAYLHSVTDRLAAPLEQAGILASNGDWEGATARTKEARETWDRYQFYFCITLRRADTDQVELGFRQIIPLLQWQEEAEYNSANAALIANIRLLNGTESLDLKNLL